MTASAHINIHAIQKDLLPEILERISDAFVALDKNWCYTYMNKKAGEIFNRDPQQMIGKHIWTEFPEGINQPFYKAYYKAMETQHYIYLEEYYPPYDLWFENHIYPSPEGLSIFFRDITAKKKTEQEHEKNKSFIESIINASPDIIYIYDIEERKNVYSNEGIQKNLGYSAEEIKEMGDKVLPILMSKEDFESYLQRIYPRYATLRDKEILTHEFRMKHKNGNWHWLSTKESIFLRKADGTPKQIFGITTDITERKIAEEKIIASDKKLRRALDKMIEGVLIVDFDLKYIYLNDHAEIVSQYPKEELIGYKMTDKYPGVEQTEIFKALTKCLNEREPQHLETEFTFPDGVAKWFLVSLQPVEEGAFILYFEITKRKKAEEKLNELNEIFKQAEKVAKIGNWKWTVKTNSIIWTAVYTALNPASFQEV